jgi:hypothetical protein
VRPEFFYNRCRASIIGELSWTSSTLRREANVDGALRPETVIARRDEPSPAVQFA